MTTPSLSETPRKPTVSSPNRVFLWAPLISLNTVHCRGGGLLYSLPCNRLLFKTSTTIFAVLSPPTTQVTQRLSHPCFPSQYPQPPPQYQCPTLGSTFNGPRPLTLRPPKRFRGPALEPETPPRVRHLESEGGRKDTDPGVHPTSTPAPDIPAR